MSTHSLAAGERAVLLTGCGQEAGFPVTGASSHLISLTNTLTVTPRVVSDLLVVKI